MKTTQTCHNFLKLYLLQNKKYKSFLRKQNFQLIKLKNIELQLKKIIKLFFKILYKSRYLFNFNIYYKLLNQFQQKTVFYKNCFLNLNLLISFSKKQQINWTKVNQYVNSEFIQLFWFFSGTFKKNQKIYKIFGDLTNVIISNVIPYLEKTKNCFYYNYLIFWNSKNFFFILRLFYFLTLKIKKAQIKNQKFIKLIF